MLSLEGRIKLTYPLPENVSGYPTFLLAGKEVAQYFLNHRGVVDLATIIMGNFSPVTPAGSTPAS